MNRENRNLLIYSFLLSLLFLAFCTKSSFLYPYNDWYDANNFLTMGKGIVHGLIPYRDLYEQKGILLYFLHSVCYLIPGPHSLVYIFWKYWRLCFFYSMPAKSYNYICRPDMPAGYFPFYQQYCSVQRDFVKVTAQRNCALH